MFGCDLVGYFETFTLHCWSGRVPLFDIIVRYSSQLSTSVTDNI